MAGLPSSGAISMSAIEDEYNDYFTAGYGLGNYYGLSRGLPTSGQISYDDFHSENAYCAVGVGSYDTGYGMWYGYQSGVSGEPSFGTVAESFDYWFPGNTTPATVYMMGVFWTEADSVYLRVSTNASYYSANSNATFYRLFINGTSFIRSSATSSTGTGYREWLWSSITTNPFGTSGTKQVALRMS